MPAAYDTYNYPAYWVGREYEHESEVIALKSFLNRIPKIKRLAEIGAGYGRLTPYYTHRAKTIFLIDPSRKILLEAKKRLGNNPKINFKQSSLENLTKNFHHQKFDLVIIVRVLHHIKDIKKAFLVIEKLVSPGGYVILEFANKIHWKAVSENLAKGDFTFPIDIFPQDKRSKKSRNLNSIPFFNYHPDVVAKLLEENNFRVIEVRSVSNIRNTIAKKYLPKELLLAIERQAQRPLAKIAFGPSLFILAKKL